MIKVTTFPSTRYGLLHGTVQRVSTDAVLVGPPGASQNSGSVSAVASPAALVHAVIDVAVYL